MGLLSKIGLRSKLFRGDPKLEACLIRDSAHVTQGALGDHVAKIHAALSTLDGPSIDPDELSTKKYGPSTAAAVLAFKTKRKIINFSYQNQADTIVGKMTIAALDREMLPKEIQWRTRWNFLFPPSPPRPSNAQPPPEAAADPLFPLWKLPDNQYVLGQPQLRFWRFLRDYVPAKDYAYRQETAEEKNTIIKRILKDYYPYTDETFTVPNPNGYPIGTILPVKIVSDDHLFVFDWHPDDKPSQHHPGGWHPGITALKPKPATVLDLLGTWLVTFQTGESWDYRFMDSGFAFSSDIKKPFNWRNGRWSFIGAHIKLEWHTSSSEKWNLPLDAKGVNGGQWGQSLGDYRWLKAEKLNP
jgi:hypothetical protein